MQLPNAVEVELIEALKAQRAALCELLQRIDLHIEEQHAHATATQDIDEMQRLQDADPFRWHADARHALQAGLMYAARALEQPTTF